MESKTYNRYDIIFAQDEVGERMFDIVSGSVGIYSNYYREDEKLLVVLKKGDTFGEMGMIEKLPRTATAVALEKTQLNAITMDEFQDYFHDQPVKVSKILHNTSQRVRALTGDFVAARLAVSEYVRCKEQGEDISSELMGKMKKIVKSAHKA